jgi:chorismate mutase
MTIDDLRQRIDDIDEDLVRLLSARAACALAIGRLKEELGLAIYQPDRERQVLAHVRQVNPGPLDGEAIARLFERIIDEARRLERVAKNAHHREGQHQPADDRPASADGAHHGRGDAGAGD